MKQKNIILTILILTLVLNICHDFLPYHNHGINHYINNNHDQVISDIESGCSCNAHKHCDGHKLCVTCLLKTKISFHIDHQEVDFSINPTNIILKIKNIEIPKNLCSHLYQNDNAHILKSKFKKRPHSLRAPPFIV